MLTENVPDELQHNKISPSISQHWYIPTLLCFTSALD